MSAASCPGRPSPRACPHRQYYWYDERGKKVKCTAPQSVDFVMSSVQKLVTDEDVFPTKYGACPRPAPPRPAHDPAPSRLCPPFFKPHLSASCFQVSAVGICLFLLVAVIFNSYSR